MMLESHHAGDEMGNNRPRDIVIGEMGNGLPEISASVRWAMDCPRYRHQCDGVYRDTMPGSGVNDMLIFKTHLYELPMYGCWAALPRSRTRDFSILLHCEANGAGSSQSLS